MNILKKSEVVTFVTGKVIEHFSKFDSVPSKLEIQNYISSFVDDYKVDTGKWDTKGDKPQKILKDLVDYYTKMSVNEIHSCQEEILKNISKVTYPEVVKSGNQKEALLKILHACKAFAWNIQADDQVNFLEALFHFFENAKGVKKYQEGIYIKGEVEGGGKSTLIHSIVDPSVGFLKVKNASWPTGRFADVSPFCSANITYIEDTSNNQKKEIDETKLKAILRKEPVECERKGLDAVEMKSVASLIAAGNVEAPNAKDRNWRIFDVIPVDLKNPDFLESDIWKSICEQTGEIEIGKPIHSDFSFFENFGDFENFESFLSKFRKSENDEKKSTIQTTKYSWFTRLQNRLKYLPTILETLNKMKNGPFNFNYISAKQIIDFAKDIGHPLSDEWKLISTLKLLAANEVIDKIKGGSSNDIYKRFDLKGLENLSYEELSGESPVEYVVESVKDQVKNSQDNWEKIIKYFEGNFPGDPEPKKEVTDEEFPFKVDKESKLDDSWTVLDRYDKEGAYNKDGDQACVNKPLEGECKNREDNRVHKQNYLFECDNISLEEQCKKIWNLPESFRKCILWACKTGGKSIHVVMATNTPDYASSKMRQYIHSRINDMIFDGKADPSTYNAGRIARAPNATRHDKKHPKAHQTCYLFNMNAEKLDVSKFVKEFEEIEEEKKFFYRFKEMNTQAYEKKGEGIHTLEELRKWNESHPSDAKRECIDFLEGNLKDWNRGVACVRELRLFGFSDDEIVFEGPVNDTWIEGAIKYAK